MRKEDAETAKRLLKEFKGDSYAFGENALKVLERFVERIGRKVAVVSGGTGRRSGIVDFVSETLSKKGYDLVGVLDGARPNTPREDVYRLAYQFLKLKCNGAVSYTHLTLPTKRIV